MCDIMSFRKTLVPVFSQQAANSAIAMSNLFGRKNFKIIADYSSLPIFKRWKINPDREHSFYSITGDLPFMLIKPKRIVLFVPTTNLREYFSAIKPFIDYGFRNNLPLSMFFNGQAGEMAETIHLDSYLYYNEKNRIITSNSATHQGFFDLKISQKNILTMPDPFIFFSKKMKNSIENMDETSKMMCFIGSDYYGIRDMVFSNSMLSKIFSHDAKTIFFSFKSQSEKDLKNLKILLSKVDEIALREKDGINLFVVCENENYGKVNNAVNSIPIAHTNLFVVSIEDIVNERLKYPFEFLLFSSDVIISNDYNDQVFSRVFGKPTISFGLAEDFKWCDGKTLSIPIQNSNIIEIALKTALSGKFYHKGIDPEMAESLRNLKNALI